MFQKKLEGFHTNGAAPFLMRQPLHGGLEEIRTPDPRNANAMRSQLRYEPGFVKGGVASEGMSLP